MRGVFIAFEGLDGSGKTTQFNALRDRLLQQGIKCREEREPSDGLLGQLARSVVQMKVTLSPYSLALLFAADRYEHVSQDILPRINKGEHVLTDRFLLSNLAYQGVLLPYDDLYCYNRSAIELLLPDITFFIDTAPEVCLQRIDSSRTGRELFDLQGQSIRERFLASIEKLGKQSSIIIIDGNQPKDSIGEEIWRHVKPLFIGG